MGEQASSKELKTSRRFALSPLANSLFKGSPMAAVAVLGVLDVEGLLSIVAFPAEFAFGDLAHVHFVGTLRHLEDLVMAPGAFEAFLAHVPLVAEKDRRGLFRSERQVTPAHLLSECAERKQKTTGQYD
jgi:hypothetical protein